MFDDFIRNKANEHQAPVPPDAWHNIIKQQKKKRFGFFWWSSIVLLVGGLSVTGYLISKKQNGNNIVTTAENKTAPAKKETTGNRLQPAATNINTETPLPGKQTTAGNDNHPAVTNVDPAKNNTGVTQVGTNTITYKGDKNIESNKGKLLADNGRKKKHIKGKLQYNNTGSDPEEINEGAENKNLPAEQMDITAAQSATTINTVIPGSTTNQTPVDKTATVITNQEKTITAINTTNESKKENKPLTKQSKHHWYIDAGITPLLTAQQYDENIAFNRTLLSNNNLSIFSAKLVSTSIDPSVAFSISARRELSKKLTVGLGLQYLLLKENITISGNETNTAYSIVQRLVNGSTGPELINDTVATVTEGTRNINAVNSYHLYSIPVFIQYHFVQKRSWSLATVGGMYINISSSYQNDINQNAAALLIATPATGNPTNIGLDVFAGLRFGKSIGNKIEFFALPSLRWNLGKYNIKNSLLNKTINQAGLSIGISYKVN